MFHLLNILPIQVRLPLLLCFEILTIFGFAKYRQKIKRPFKGFIQLLMIFNPIYIINMVLNYCVLNGIFQITAQNAVWMNPDMVGVAFLIGLIIIGVLWARNGDTHLERIRASGIVVFAFMIALLDLVSAELLMKLLQ